MDATSTLLIVDDEASARDTLEALLFAQGYNLIFANNGSDALAKAAQFQPDVILLDVMMPELDGFEVCQRVRADPLLAEVPIIMVTALDDQDSRLAGLQAGADDFISKPFDRLELRARIRTITQLNRYRRLLAERTKFEWVVDQANEGYLILQDHQTILYANPQACHYLGGETMEQLISNSFFTLIAKNHYNLHPQESWDNWSEPRQDSTALYLVQPATSTSAAIWLEVNKLTMPADSTGENCLIRLCDITDRVTDKRMQWVFHTQVGHKLRTPLALFDGFLEYFLQEEDNLSKTEKETLQTKVRNNAAQLKQYILEIFEYLNISDKITSQNRCSSAQIVKLITEVALQLDITPPKVTYSPNKDVHDARELPLSSQAIEIIFLELLENARKFHPQHTPAINISIIEQTGKVCFQVADNGTTLSNLQLSRIWIPYYQAEISFTGQVPGMGLGLPTIASLIWGVNGTCRAYNQPEEPGVVIEITLPLI